jgi:hypothetical protein
MKIYTEEQVNDAIGWYVKLKIKLKKDVTIQEAFNRLTPIELPSDEDVEKMRKAYIEHVNIIVHKDLERDGYLNIAFLKGAKCVIDKIQGGDK